MQNEATIEEPLDGPHRRPCHLSFFHYVWLFILGSIIGLVLEVVVNYFLHGRWESRVGFVLGPLSPLYGFGAVIGTLAVNPLRDKSVFAQFAAGAVVGGLLEYLAATLLEERYGIVAWSYIDQPLNFHGRTSVGIMAIWGITAVVWARWALPALISLIELIPPGIRTPITAIAFAYLVIDAALTVAALDSWFWRQAGYPIANPIQQFCATYFDDAFMSERFETMGMWTELAHR